MRVLFRSCSKLQTGNNPFYFIYSTLSTPSTNFRQTLTLTLEMGNESTSKRPMCPSCTKPTRLCLCNRMTTSILENSVAVTILQHSLEKNHPLNSTRIATLGLKNLNLEWVSDVNFEAQFDIHMLQQNCQVGAATSIEKNAGFCGIQNHKSSDLLVDSKRGQFSRYQQERNTSCFTFTIEKYGVISSFNNQLVSINGKQKVSFDNLLASMAPLDDFSKGFIVKKFQKRQSDVGIDCEEFEMEVPPGSVLLFPSEKSVSVGEINFEVTNLIVLDGTWAKARRVYNENPWLKLLPHLRLDLDKLSLYSEVRHQPRAGYLSTIESIVYALKAVGENPEGLDGLLDVFASMIGDQRRCKDERLSKAANLVRVKW